MAQSVFDWNGLGVEVMGTMSRSPGISPDSGRITWLSGQPQPASPFGQLTLRHGGNIIDQWSVCALDDPFENVGSGGRSISYTVLDKRWTWKNYFLFGSYNVRDQNGDIILSTFRTVQQLAAYALTEMGETGYSVAGLPNVAGPQCNFHYEPAALFLDRLCTMYGCQIHIEPISEVVLIRQRNDGLQPLLTNLKSIPSSGVDIKQKPFNIIAYAGDTIFDGWLALDAVGFELDGSMRSAESLSYRPTEGWSVDEDGNLDTQRLRFELEIDRGTAPAIADKIVELAERHVFRTYRVIGWPAGQTAPLGDSAAPFTTHTNGTGQYQIVDNSFNVLGSFATRVEAEEGRAGGGIGGSGLMVASPGMTIFDPRNILPLEPQRAVSQADPLTGEKMPAYPEVMGFFWGAPAEGSDYAQNEFQLWEGRLNLDEARGMVTLDRPAFQVYRDSGAAEGEEVKIAPGDMFLRTGYRLRATTYGNVYHRRVVHPFSTVGAGSAVVDRSDVHEIRVGVYGNEFQGDFTGSGVQSNTTLLDAFLTDSAIDQGRQYVDQAAPTTYEFSPPVTHRTDGVRQQVTHSCGVNRPGTTIVSVGSESNQALAPEFVRQVREQQRLTLQSNAQNFGAGSVIEDRRRRGILE